MKFFSKLVSTVAAVAMLASMAIMPAVHAADATIKLTVIPNKEEGYFDLKVSYSDAVGDAAKMGTAGFNIAVDSDYFKLSNAALASIGEEEIPEDWSTSLAKPANVTITYDSGDVVFAYFTSKTSQALPASIDNLITMRFDVVNSEIWTDGYEFSFDGTVTVGSNNKSNDGTLKIDLTDAVIKAAGEEIKKTGDESETDLAVGAIKEYAAGVSGTIDFTGTATLVGGGTKKFKKTVSVPTISGAAKVGLIVSFDGSVYTDFVID